MSHTNDWNEASPAGTDLISNGDNEIRQMKLDIRERMQNDHYWNVSKEMDGHHNSILQRLGPDAVAFTSTGFVATSPNTPPLIDIRGEWNTTGPMQAFYMDITDTMSDAFSNLMVLRISGQNKFIVQKTGTTHISGQLITNGVTLTVPDGRITGLNPQTFASLDASQLTNLPPGQGLGPIYTDPVHFTGPTVIDNLAVIENVLAHTVTITQGLGLNLPTEAPPLVAQGAFRIVLNGVPVAIPFYP